MPQTYAERSEEVKERERARKRAKTAANREAKERQKEEEEAKKAAKKEKNRVRMAKDRQRKKEAKEVEEAKAKETSKPKKTITKTTKVSQATMSALQPITSSDNQAASKQRYRKLRDKQRVEDLLKVAETPELREVLAKWMDSGEDDLVAKAKPQTNTTDNKEN